MKYIFMDNGIIQSPAHQHRAFFVMICTPWRCVKGLTLPIDFPPLGLILKKGLPLIALRKLNNFNGNCPQSSVNKGFVHEPIFF